jgi:hypothetical protein
MNVSDIFLRHAISLIGFECLEDTDKFTSLSMFFSHLSFFLVYQVKISHPFPLVFSFGCYFFLIVYFEQQCPHYQRYFEKVEEDNLGVREEKKEE